MTSVISLADGRKTRSWKKDFIAFIEVQNWLKKKKEE